MPTLSLSGSAQRADGVQIVDLMLLTPSTAVDEDSIKTISLTNTAGASPSIVVAFGNVTQAAVLYMVSDVQLTVALTIPGPTALAAFKAKVLLIDTTEIVGATLTNTSVTAGATVRFLIGGAA